MLNENSIAAGESEPIITEPRPAPEPALNPNVPEFVPSFVAAASKKSVRDDPDDEEGTDGDTEEEPEDVLEKARASEKSSVPKVDKTGADWVEVETLICGCWSLPLKETFLNWK